MEASEYLQTTRVLCYTVNQMIKALENMTDPLKLNGLVLRLDYLIHTPVNLDDNSQTDEILRLFSETLTN